MLSSGYASLRRLAVALLICRTALDLAVNATSPVEVHRAGSLVRRQRLEKVTTDDQQSLSQALHDDVLVPGLGSDSVDHTASSSSFVEVDSNGASNRTLQAAPSNAKKLYTIKVLGKYCSDNAEAPVKCTSKTIGTWETFHIYHFQRRPDLHVMQGGQSRKWCRDHWNHISCNREEYSDSEYFKLVTMGTYKAIRGPEKDMWCAVDEGKLACNEPDLSKGEAMHFILEEIPYSPLIMAVRTGNGHHKQPKR